MALLTAMMLDAMNRICWVVLLGDEVTLTT